MFLETASAELDNASPCWEGCRHVLNHVQAPCLESAQRPDIRLSHTPGIADRDTT